MNVRIPHFFSSEDIAIILTDPAIALHKNEPGQMVHFSVTVPDSIQAKLKKIMNFGNQKLFWVLRT